MEVGVERYEPPSLLLPVLLFSTISVNYPSTRAVGCSSLGLARYSLLLSASCTDVWIRLCISKRSPVPLQRPVIHGGLDSSGASEREHGLLRRPWLAPCGSTRQSRPLCSKCRMCGIARDRSSRDPFRPTISQAVCFLGLHIAGVIEVRWLNRRSSEPRT